MVHVKGSKYEIAAKTCLRERPICVHVSGTIAGKRQLGGRRVRWVTRYDFERCPKGLMDITKELDARTECQAAYGGDLRDKSLRAERWLTQFTPTNIFAAEHHHEQDEDLMLPVNAASSPDFR